MLNVGLLAHVDAGKTTLSEAMLYTAGQLRKLGRVDHRDAFLDTDAQERERGITIFSKQAMLTWQGVEITLLDTPGHVDFSSEMERTLRVIDCAVLVISGADGVQGHTLTLWRLLQAYGVPTVLFVNKMDQPGTDRTQLMHTLRARLSDACVDVNAPDALDDIALCGEAAMESLLETGDIPLTEIRKLTKERRLFPCLFGSALKNKGVDALLDALLRYVPVPAYPAEFAARVFKISRDPQGARLTWIKVTWGSLRVKTLLECGEKINQIRAEYIENESILIESNKFTMVNQYTQYYDSRIEHLQSALLRHEFEAGWGDEKHRSMMQRVVTMDRKNIENMKLEKEEKIAAIQDAGIVEKEHKLISLSRISIVN